MSHHREIWKPVPGYVNFYEVSSLGRMKRIKDGGPAKAGSIVNGYLDSCGYPRIRLCKPGGNLRQFRIHQLVMSAFVGPANGKTVNHKNRMRTDNRLDNLEYLSHADNIRYSRDSYSRKGELNSRARFRPEDVLEIRKLYAEGWGLTQLARLYQNNKHTIYDIVNRRSWRHI